VNRRYGIWYFVHICGHSQDCLLLVSCLINAQLLPAHRLAADDNYLIVCTSHDLTDDWSLASTHFVDSLCPFRCSFGCVFYWTRCFENSVPFDNTTPIYLINLLWKLGFGFRLDSELHYFSIFHGE